MKGLLGRKIGMTQVYTDHGKSIAVSVVEIQPNIVTSVFTKEKDGYAALQLGIVDVKKNIQKKPEIGHFKKANTAPKKFVKEIRGMEGHDLGAKVDVSIFNPGELVDVTGTAKGKGFAGAIKRHNQSIGPKSHGGGGGSQPTRQTGSLGDIAGNKVVKGMTMPGQMGNVQRTQQNLEIVSVDKLNNLLLIKGSIPGPRKSYVIVREAVKGLPAKAAKELIDMNAEEIKNDLIAQAKKLGVEASQDMQVEDIQTAINVAKEAEKVAAEKKAAAAEKKAAADQKAALVAKQAVAAAKQATKATTASEKPAAAPKKEEVK